MFSGEHTHLRAKVGVCARESACVRVHVRGRPSLPAAPRRLRVYLLRASKSRWGDILGAVGVIQLHLEDGAQVAW